MTTMTWFTIGSVFFGALLFTVSFVLYYYTRKLPLVIVLATLGIFFFGVVPTVLAIFGATQY